MFRQRYIRMAISTIESQFIQRRPERAARVARDRINRSKPQDFMLAQSPAVFSRTGRLTLLEDILIANGRNETCDACRTKGNERLVSIPAALLDLPTAEWLMQSTGKKAASARLISPGSAARFSSMPPSCESTVPPLLATIAFNWLINPGTAANI
jgi:hypothetical protein